MRWYCWLIFFAVAIFSTWALPADGDVEERNSLLSGNEDTDIEDFLAESAVWDDDDDGIVENGTSGITDRYLRRRKPQKYKQDDDYSSSEDTDKDTKKSKTTKCVCYGKKPFYYYLKPYPYQSGKPRPPPSSPSTPASSSSQRPGGQGYPNQSGSNTNRPNSYNDQRPRPPNGF